MPPRTAQRVIAHLDLDCFYVQVEQRRLALGKPPWTSRDSPAAAVQQWDGLIAVNYAARAHGVKRGMRAADARKACPDITLVHVETISEGTEDMSADQGDSLAPDRRTQKACLRRYRQASEEVFAVVQRHAARCEMASIDEVYLDLTEEANQRVASGALDFPQLATSAVCPSGCTADAKDSHLLAALDLVQKLRDDIFTDTGFTVSAGISESKLVAKLASACHKPNRQTLVPSAGVLSFMAAVKLKDLRGLGGKLGQKLRSSLQLDPEAPSAELQKVPLVELQRILGEQSAAFVHRLCRGEDNEDVKPGEMKRKQYLSFKSLSPPAESISDLEPWLASLAAELVGRIREDPTRQPRSLVLYHRGRLDSDHGRNWMAGRTSELTKTISRSMAFPDLQMNKGEIGMAAASIVADAAKKMLLERVTLPFPCSRLALGASDFRKVEPGSSITAFFSQKAKPQEVPHEVPQEEAVDQEDVLLTQAQTDSEGSEAEEAPKPESKDMPAANVAEFHRASRLHFLGTWRERFECWRAEGGAGQLPQEHTEQLRKELSQWKDDAAGELWAHLDMDCFFVSVATRDAAKAGDTSISDEVPAAVVSGLGPSSEICSANYAARRAGVNTHLWFVERAMSMLPTLRLFPITSELLRSVEDTWKQVYQILVTACNDVPDNVLMRSCDESAIRVNGFREPVAWAQALRKAVYEQTGCTCSVGLGPTQLVAKLATKACKPNGVRRILDEEVKKFIADLPLKDMPQVGRAMVAKLQERGLENCSDVQALEKNRLREWFGAKGETLWLNAQGLDQESSLVPVQRKSVSAEMNWGIRCHDRAAALKILFEVAKQLCDRLSVCKLRANHLTLKLKIAIPGWVEPIKKGGHGQCDDVSRSSSLPSESSDLNVLQRCAQQLFDSLSPDPVRLRGLGLAARLGTGGEASSSRSPKKTSAGVSSIARWLRKAVEEPVENKAKLQDVVDLDADQEILSESKNVICPVCGQQVPSADGDAHVNSHFDQSQPVSVQPPPKRLRFSSEQQGARPAGSDECVIIL